MKNNQIPKEKCEKFLKLLTPSFKGYYNKISPFSVDILKFIKENNLCLENSYIKDLENFSVKNNEKDIFENFATLMHEKLTFPKNYEILSLVDTSKVKLNELELIFDGNVFLKMLHQYCLIKKNNDFQQYWLNMLLNKKPSNIYYSTDEIKKILELHRKPSALDKLLGETNDLKGLILLYKLTNDVVPIKQYLDNNYHLPKLIHKCRALLDSQKIDMENYQYKQINLIDTSTFTIKITLNKDHIVQQSMNLNPEHALASLGMYLKNKFTQDSECVDITLTSEMQGRSRQKYLNLEYKNIDKLNTVKEEAHEIINLFSNFISSVEGSTSEEYQKFVDNNFDKFILLNSLEKKLSNNTIDHNQSKRKI